MNEPSGGGSSRKPKKKMIRWPLLQRNFVGNDDDTDRPDFDKGSGVSVVVVLVLLGLGVALMFMLSN